MLRVHGLTGTLLVGDAGIPAGGNGGAGGGSGVAVGDDVIWSTESRDIMTSSDCSFTVAPAHVSVTAH